MRFVDTDVLIYSICFYPEDEEKAGQATLLLEAGDLTLSVQVLQEFYAQATRPSRPGRLSHAQAVAFISKWLRFPVQDLTVPLMQTALAATARWQISYWDATIIEAARASGCNEVLSEDLNHGQDYSGIRVTNPFL